MEKFLKECKPNKMKKGELARLIFDNQTDIVSFYINKGYNKKFTNLITTLYEKMSHPRFAEALQYIIKKSKKDEEVYLDIGFAVIINGFLESLTRDNNADKNADIPVADYCEIAHTLVKKIAKKISKEVDITIDTIKDIIVVAPSKDYISNDKFVGIYSQKMLRKLYIIASDPNRDVGVTTTKQVKKLFSALFGKKLLDLIAVNILLEKREFIKGYSEKQLTLWNLMTEFALETIEKQDKKHISELLKYYASRRFADERNQRDAARRINFSSINTTDYPHLSKAISKCDNPKITKYL